MRLQQLQESLGVQPNRCSARPRHPLSFSQPVLGSPSKGVSLFGQVWSQQDLSELPVDRIPVFAAPELREGGTTAFLALI